MTDTSPIYLKPNVVFEPLINQWYAWTFLLQPATCALVTKQVHLRIMESFVRAPRCTAAPRRKWQAAASSTPARSRCRPSKP